MADLQVTCINKQPRNDTHEGISHLGGATWNWTQQQVIDFDQKRLEHFLHARRRQAAEVAVVNGPTAESGLAFPAIPRDVRRLILLMFTGC